MNFKTFFSPKIENLKMTCYTLLHNFDPVCQKISYQKEKIQPQKIIQLNTSQIAKLENEKDKKRFCAEKVTYCKCLCQIIIIYQQNTNSTIIFAAIVTK